VSLASPAMLAFGVACSEGTLAATGAGWVNTAATGNSSLGLSQNTAINDAAGGNYVVSVTTANTNVNAPTVVVQFQTTALNNRIPAVMSGATVTYTGACNTGAGLTWTPTSTMAAKYVPKA
jgi:hypothetical protein